MTKRSYSVPQKVLHWATAVLVFALAGSGMAYFLELADDSAINFHQVAGQLLIVILSVRLAVRLKDGVPAADLSHPKLERYLAKTVHGALYLALITYVVTGYVSASALRDNVILWPASLSFARSDVGDLLLEVHYLMKWVLLGLVALHIAGALKHHFWDRDDTFLAMWFSRK